MIFVLQKREDILAESILSRQIGPVWGDQRNVLATTQLWDMKPSTDRRRGRTLLWPMGEWVAGASSPSVVLFGWKKTDRDAIMLHTGQRVVVVSPEELWPLLTYLWCQRPNWSGTVWISHVRCDGIAQENGAVIRRFHITTDDSAPANTEYL